MTRCRIGDKPFNEPMLTKINDATGIWIRHDDVIKWKHFPRYWPFVRGIHLSTVNSPHKGQWRGALIFSLICARINGWVNNREAGDLRRHRAHYNVIVIQGFTACVCVKISLSKVTFNCVCWFCIYWPHMFINYMWFIWIFNEYRWVGLIQITDFCMFLK